VSDEAGDKGGAPLIPLNVPRQSRSKRPDHMARVIEEMIVSGEFAPGVMLPPEMDLAERFGVSRTVIREGVRILQVRGLVEIRHGVGTQVTGSGRSAFASALLLTLRRSGCTMGDLMDFRKLVEPEMAATAALRATARDLAQLKEALAEYVMTIGEYPEQMVKAHLKFHKLILQATHNPVVDALIDPLTQLILLSANPPGTKPRKQTREILDSEAHQDIYKAICAGDSLGARRSMLTDLNNAVGDNRSTPIASEDLGAEVDEE
jgi:GntR family transcriptional repressor for pyruvate dehydrogenase complex